MRSTYIPAGSTIGNHWEVADKLMLIVSGSVKILLPGTPNTVEKNQPGHLLTIGPGGSIGDNSILGDTRWSGLYGIDADFVANENCKICYIRAKDILVRILHSLEGQVSLTFLSCL